MFGNWFRRKGHCEVIPVLEEGAGLEEVMRGDLVLLFKHSAACPVSWAAHSQVTRFLGAHPEAQVRMIPVLKERQLSQKIAAATGIRHESPQVIALRRGEVVDSASHGEITADRLSEMLSEAR
jgi:bacillithiol system protein YtxJ